ncbi:MAG: hypothetical protein Kow0062_19090 [Acidobacteriota bacterium]
MAEGNRRFGQYLRALRHSKHLTLDDVCQLSRDEPVPISRAVLSDLENGRANLTTGRLITLSRIYGVRPAVLVERFETDYELDLADRDRIEKWPTQKLFDEARRAGMSGHVHRALLLYEEAELRALEGKDEDSENVRVRARLGVARALHAAGRWHVARQVLEDLLHFDLDHTSLVWALFMLAQVAVDTGARLLAKGALVALREVPGPLPAEIASSLPYVEARCLDEPDTEDSVLDAWMSARDAAKRGGVATVEGYAMLRLAQVERARGRLSRARRWVSELLAFADAHEFPWHKAYALIEQALILTDAKDEFEARETWLRAKTLARRHKFHDLLFVLHAERWRIAKQRNNDVSARSELAAASRALRHIDHVPEGYKDIERILESVRLVRQENRGRTRRNNEEDPK